MADVTAITFDVATRRPFRRALWFLLAITAALALSLGRAVAVPPLTQIDSQVTDQSGVLSPDQRAELEQGIANLPDGESLYVVYVDSFDGLDGAQWASQTHDQSQLGSAWLLAIATHDRLWGTAYLTGTNSDTVAKVNYATQTALSAYRDNPEGFNWAEPGLAMARVIADPESASAGISNTAAILLSLAIIAVITALTVPLVIRTQRKAKEKAQADFTSLWSLQQLPADQQKSLDNTRRQISIAVDFLSAHPGQISPLAISYVQLAMDQYEAAKAANAAGEATIYGRPIGEVLNDARAYARAGLGTAANDVGDQIPAKKLSRQFGFDMNLETWAAMQMAADYPDPNYGWQRWRTTTGQPSYAGTADGTFAAVGGTFGGARGGSFADARGGTGGSFGGGAVGGSFGTALAGRGGTFAPTKSFDRGPGGDLHVDTSSTSSASFGGSSGSGGSF